MAVSGMTLQIISLVVLVLAFVLGTVRPINLGAIALAATFVIGVLAAGLSTKDAIAGFPVELMLILVGVTYLFNVGRENGAVDWLIASAVRAVRGRTALIPWVMFAVTALLSGIGAVFSPPIVAPIALAFAAKHRIPQPLMGIMVVHGAAAGSLSPISVYGITVAGVLEQSGLPSDPAGLFLLAFVASLIPAIIVFLYYGGTRRGGLATEPGPDEAGTGTSAGGPATGPTGPGRAGSASLTATTRAAATVDTVTAVPALTLDIVLTTTAIAALLVGAVFRLDVGLLAITLATLLGVHRHQHHDRALRDIPWTVVLLVGGTITYVAVLQKIGAVDYLGDLALAIGAPIVTVLLLGYLAGVVSAFASSAGTIAALTPLTVPLLQNSTMSVLPVVAVVAIAATIVDISPFSGNGASVIANATPDQREKVYRTQLVYGGIVVLLAPLLLWLTIVVPTTG
jgi:di/tricarboxylate transporter